jgi:hypothetical protein
MNFIYGEQWKRRSQSKENRALAMAKYALTLGIFAYIKNFIKSLALIYNIQKNIAIRFRIINLTANF